MNVKLTWGQLCYLSCVIVKKRSVLWEEKTPKNTYLHHIGWWTCLRGIFNCYLMWGGSFPVGGPSPRQRGMECIVNVAEQAIVGKPVNSVPPFASA